MARNAGRQGAASDLDEVMARLRAHLPDVREHYHVSGLWLFGSFVRGEQRRRSDVDILVQFARTPGLLQLIGLEQQLSAVVGRKVDLVMVESLRGRIGERILQERVPV